MPRRTIPPRPALVADVMPVLLRRRDHTVPIRQWVMQGRLPKGLYGFTDALYGCRERGLLTINDRLPGRAGRAILLTPTGLAWTPREDGTPVPLVYTWRYQGRPVLGPLADWGRQWAATDHPVPGDHLGWTLAAEQHNAYMPHVHEIPEGWRIVAAGEQAIVPKTVRKELPACLTS
jgi:hypothetical protein